MIKPNAPPPDPVPLRVDEDNVMRVSDTRVTLDTVVGAFIQGDTPEEIAANYPAVSLAEVYAVISYYLHHEAEVKAYLQARTDLAAEVRQKIEARWSSVGIRERLLARQAAAHEDAQ